MDVSIGEVPLFACEHMTTLGPVCVRVRDERLCSSLQGYLAH